MLSPIYPSFCDAEDSLLEPQSFADHSDEEVDYFSYVYNRRGSTIEPRFYKEPNANSMT